MKVFYVIRSGWNAANQSSLDAKRNAKNRFESNEFKLVAIVEADDPVEACGRFEGSVYNGQSLFATDNEKSVKGLVKAIRQYNQAITDEFYF